MSAQPPTSGLAAVPDEALVDVALVLATQQQATRLLWETVVRAYDAAAQADREFVADELALVMGCHPRSAQAVVVDALQARDFPALMAAWTEGHLTDRHVKAAVEELLTRLTEQPARLRVLDQVLDACRRRHADGRRWPTPGELARMIRVAALLADADGAARRKEEATAHRGAHSSALPHGQAMLALEGPEERIAAMHEALRARAAEAARQPGETRTRAQLEFDLAEELLRGGILEDGQDPVAYDVQLVMPLDTATGEGQALGELPGLGPVLPGTCLVLLARASTLTRICTDPATGRVLTVDDPVRVDQDPDAITAALAAMRTAPVVLPDLSSDRYRPTARALRFVKTRDRTCRFPGCTLPARFSDVDHELPWPRGRTDPRNLHCLCRHHHRAKQSGLFTVHTEPDGTTVWTLTRTGQAYRSPPAALCPTL
jgi:hypothetical protein